MTAPAIDLLDGEFYRDDPWPVYAWMRRNDPIHWDERRQLWGIARHRDVVEVERRPDLFCSGQGSRPKLPGTGSMIDSDDPRHNKHRRLVNKGLTPKGVAALETHVRDVVTGVIDRAAPLGRCDFAEDIAVPVPMVVIAELLGVPPEDSDRLQHWSDVLIDGSGRYDDEEGLTLATEAYGEFCEYQMRIFEERRREPHDDMCSALVHAEIDGERLTERELLAEAILLLIGGNETTRNVITGAMEALIQHPDQRQRLLAEPALLPTAVEEFLRWVTPIVNMRRTATQDTELDGRPIRAGDELVLLYGSANRDEEVFADPQRFDVGRDPNPHVAFGWGTHFCLGAALARLEIRVVFEEVLRRLPDVELSGDVAAQRAPNAFIRGIQHMDVVLTPRDPVAARQETAVGTKNPTARI